MITLKLQLLLLIFSLSGFIILLNMISKYRLELKYALLWLGLSLLTVLLAIFPNISMILTSIMSIESPVNALFLFFIGFSLAILFSLSVALSRTSQSVKNLTQELGIMKAELNKLTKQTETSKVTVVEENK